MSGALREPWQQFFRLMNTSEAGEGGLNDLTRRAALVDRQIRDNGVTYNVYSDELKAAGPKRPWQLGVLPLLIEASDWRILEQGIIQRSRLMSALAADTYGPQTMIREGLLPAALVLGHPGYLRALQGTRVAGGLFLHLCAFDVARGPDGTWWVVSQRLQAPSGLGYVLENRLIISRLFPEAFRELHVQHLASGYRRLLDTLLALAVPLAGGGSPRLALLTPGPYNETYFEHAYLARYLGLPLVEGADLTVRDGGVFLKTVQGLEPVHGLLRRLDDVWCDPLELRADSALGVPGLLQAIRAGKVMVANALGMGFLESPGIQGFLPGLSSRLLGEPLRLPSLPTWWCGEPAAREAVRATLGQRVIRATYSGRLQHFPPVQGQHLSCEALEAWQRRIDAHPEAHTLQTHLAFSQAPLWRAGELVPRTAMLRVYAVADAHGGWYVMPGGMTRIAAADPHWVSMQHGGSSMDTWVMTDAPVDVLSMQRPHAMADDLGLRHRPVASRTAENLFWMGRYTERTEHLVRLAQACESLVDDDDDMPTSVLRGMTELAQYCGLAPRDGPALTDEPGAFERSVILSLADAQASRGATSIAWNLTALQRCAESLRERLSPEHWRLVRVMSEDFAHRVGRAVKMEVAGRLGFGATELQDALEHLAVQLAAVTGAQSDRMTRDHGWRLLTVGRLTERLILMTEVLRVFAQGTPKVHTEVDAAPALCSAQGMDLVLTLFDSTITFRARYQRREDMTALLDLVLLDESNPRALACILRRLRTEISKLPTGDPSPMGLGLEGLLAHLPPEGVGIGLGDFRAAMAPALEQGEVEGRWRTPAQEDRARLVQLVSGLAEQLHQAAEALADDISRRYFAHADGSDRMLTL